MDSYFNSKPVTSIFITQICFYCCSDLEFVKECSKRCESILTVSNNQYYIQDSALVTFELRQNILDSLLERKSKNDCSEIAKVYIDSKNRNKSAKTIEEYDLNQFLNYCPEKVKEYFILKYLFLMNDRCISSCLHKSYYQLDYYKAKIKKHLKCKEYDLIEAAAYIDRNIIEKYNQKTNCNPLSQETIESLIASNNDIKSKSLRIVLLIIATIFILKQVITILYNLISN